MNPIEYRLADEFTNFYDQPVFAQVRVIILDTELPKHKRIIRQIIEEKIEQRQLPIMRKKKGQITPEGTVNSVFSKLARQLPKEIDDPNQLDINRRLEELKHVLWWHKHEYFTADVVRDIVTTTTVALHTAAPFFVTYLRSPEVSYHGWYLDDGTPRQSIRTRKILPLIYDSWVQRQIRNSDD